MSAFVLEAKPWTRVAKPWEDWWRVQLNSRLPKFVGFFELCVHKCTRILDWLRVPTRQSNVNLYLSSFPGEKVCFLYTICNAKKCREEALDSLNMHWKSRKIKQMEEQERAVKELISGNDLCVKWGWLAYVTSKFYGSWLMYICCSLLGRLFCCHGYHVCLRTFFFGDAVALLWESYTLVQRNSCVSSCLWSPCKSRVYFRWVACICAVSGKK